MFRKLQTLGFSSLLGVAALLSLSPPKTTSLFSAMRRGYRQNRAKIAKILKGEF